MEKENIVIGIEGLVGAGKTSICRKLLKKIPNTVLLHGGNLYRAIVYTLLQEEKNILKLKFKLRKLDIDSSFLQSFLSLINGRIAFFICFLLLFLAKKDKEDKEDNIPNKEDSSIDKLEEEYLLNKISSSFL